MLFELLHKLLEVLGVLAILLHEFFVLDDVFGLHALETLESLVDVALVVGAVEHIGDFLVIDEFVACDEFLFAGLDFGLEVFLESLLLVLEVLELRLQVVDAFL